MNPYPLKDETPIPLKGELSDTTEETKKLIAEFEVLLDTERMVADAERKRSDELKAQREEEEKAHREKLDSSKKSRESVRDQQQGISDLTQGMRAFGFAMSDLLSGRLLPAAMQLAGLAHGFAVKRAAKKQETAKSQSGPATPATKSATDSKATAADGAAKAAPSKAADGAAKAAPTAESGGGGLGILGSLTGGLTIALGAVAAFAAALGGAVAAVKSLAEAGSPQTMSAIRAVWDYLIATIGGFVVPIVFEFGVELLYWANQVREVADKYVGAMGNTNTQIGGFNKAVGSTVDFLLKLNKSIGMVIDGLGKLLRGDVKGANEKFKEAAETRDTAKEQYVSSMDKVSRGVADEEDPKRSEARAELLGVIKQMMGAQSSRFEGVDNAWKRIQQAQMGKTSIDAKILEAHLRAVGLLERTANNTDPRNRVPAVRQ